MKIPSRIQIYKFFQVDHPWQSSHEHDWFAAMQWALAAFAILLAIAAAALIIGVALWALYTQTWVWVRYAVSVFLGIPLVILWLAWPTKARQAAVFLEKNKK